MIAPKCLRISLNPTNNAPLTHLGLTKPGHNPSRSCYQTEVKKFNTIKILSASHKPWIKQASTFPSSIVHSGPTLSNNRGSTLKTLLKVKMYSLLPLKVKIVWFIKLYTTAKNRTLKPSSDNCVNWKTCKVTEYWDQLQPWSQECLTFQHRYIDFVWLESWATTKPFFIRPMRQALWHWEVRLSLCIIKVVPVVH